MKVETLIEMLEDFKDEYGNLEVLIKTSNSKELVFGVGIDKHNIIIES